MKKLLGILTICAMSIVLIACASNDVVPEAGVWQEDDLFVNESLGLQFQLPRGWQGLSGDELVEVLGHGAAILSELNVDEMDNLLETMEENPVHDMFVVHPSTGSTIQLMFQRLPRAASRYTSEEALEAMIEDVERELPGLSMQMQPGSVRIGEQEFYTAIGSFEIMPGFEMAMQKFLRLDGRNATVIGITQMGDVVNIEEILTFFNVPGAERIYIPEPDVVEAADLVGTWVWNLGDDYVYTFYADGTGVRGPVINSLDEIMDIVIDAFGQRLVNEMLEEFGEDEFFEIMLLEMGVEPFEWEIANEVLYLDFEFVALFGVANEEWTAIIEDDLLTITSRQAPDLTFSYIRQ